MMNSTAPLANNQIGFHYFQDTLHYSTQDLAVWLPELTRLSASWVILLSEAERAIPEQFITSLVESGISPIIHFKLPLPGSPSAVELNPILSSYSRWGVKYVVFFDKPNECSSWSSAGWSHQDLVERFIDRFLPLAQEALRNDLIPVFPPLTPGGNYWDTSFFKSALQSLQRRGQQVLLKNMAVGSYAYTFNHELLWGEGGPQRWPQSRPYLTPDGSQDQRGFNNYVWLQSIASAAGLNGLPIVLFGAGIIQPGCFYSAEAHTELIQAMLNKVSQDQSENTILAINFWLLAADAGSNEYEQTWIKPETGEMPIVNVLAKGPKKEKSPIPEGFTPVSNVGSDPELSSRTETLDQSRFIAHYLLLPLYDWGVAEWHLEVIRPFVRKNHPTVGFSLCEAAMAQKVTVIGGDKDFSPEEISKLRNNGCIVDQISGDGTSIATQLLER